VIVRGNWVAALPEERQAAQRRLHPALPWNEAVGDRRTELVFIGREMDEEPIRTDLEACFLPDDSAASDLDGIENPFPSEEGEELVLD
jgi:hypothetical protein